MLRPLFGRINSVSRVGWRLFSTTSVHTRYTPMAAPLASANNFLDLHADAKRVISAAVVRSVNAVFNVDFNGNEQKLKALEGSFAAGGKNGDLSLQFHRFSKDFKTKPVVV